MIDLGPHGSYILASYAAAGIILGWMIVTSLLANRSAARRLATMEAREGRS
jgi:heme exporter protein CcmD